MLRNNHLLIKSMAAFILQELNDNIEENKDFIIKLYNKVGNEILVDACYQGLIKMVKFLIELGADIKYKNYQSFVNSVTKNHIELAKFLLELGADVNICNNFAIKTTIMYDKLEMFKLLVEHGDSLDKDYIKVNAKPKIKEYLVAIKNSPYYGLSSPTKLDIQLPDLQEIIKDNKYYYVYRYKYVDNCYVLEEQEKKFSILNSLNLENKVTLGLFLNLS